MPDDQIHLVGTGPKRCCHCKNDRPCNCGCVCEDMTNLDDSGNTPTTNKQPNPNEDCYKAMQFNNYNYSDDPGQPTCQDPYEEPFIGPKAPCWMFVAKDCGDHQRCTKEEALTLCANPTESIECDGEVIPVLKCYECPCTCETVSKLSGMAEGIFFNLKADCDEYREESHPPGENCQKCVEVPFPEGENGSLCDDLRSNYINCAGNSACIGQQASQKCWMIVDKTCADLGSGCVEKTEPEGLKCEPSESEVDCPLLQNCYSSCPNGTFTSEEDCGEWRDSNDDDNCYACEPCASADLPNCWCLRPLSCEENGYYDGEETCDNERVSLGCEGGGGIECATCMKNDQCSAETDVDCYELVNASCDSIGGSYNNEADCKADLVADGSNRCYKCYQITDCDDCWSGNGRSEQCWGVRPMTCSELEGMSEAFCDLEVQTRADGPCLKCTSFNCPETDDCFKLEAKTCAEMGCQEFCDDDQDTEPCPKGISGGKCPECLTCLGGCAEYGLYADYGDCEFDCDEQEEGCGTCKYVNPAGSKLYCWECQQKSCKDMGFYNSVADCAKAQGPEHCYRATDDSPYCNGRCWECEGKECRDFGRQTYADCVESNDCDCERRPTPEYGGEPCTFLDCAIPKRDCGVCKHECQPCACCPDETGGKCGTGCCCCPSAFEPRLENKICVCVAAPV